MVRIYLYESLLSMHFSLIDYFVVHARWTVFQPYAVEQIKSKSCSIVQGWESQTWVCMV